MMINLPTMIVNNENTEQKRMTFKDLGRFISFLHREKNLFYNIFHFYRTCRNDLVAVYMMPCVIGIK